MRVLIAFSALITTAVVSGQSLSPAIPITPANSGLHLNTAMINGLPASASITTDSNHVIYNHATSSSAQTWVNNITLGIADSMYGYVHLASINDKPAVVYVGSGTNRINYKCGLDSFGHSWGPSVRVDSLSYYVRNPYLAQCNRRPAISFYDGNGLKFAIATH